MSSNDCNGSCASICVNSCAGYCAKACEVDVIGGILHTIEDWATLDGLQVLDPDGFDRSDPLLWERKFTREEYMAGLPFCTIAPLGWK